MESAALSIIWEVALSPPMRPDGRAEWHGVYRQAAHLVPQCWALDEVEPYLRGFIAAVEDASLGMEPA